MHGNGETKISMMHQCPETINGFSVDSCVVKMSMEMPQVSATKKQQKNNRNGQIETWRYRPFYPPKPN